MDDLEYVNMNNLLRSNMLTMNSLIRDYVDFADDLYLNHSCTKKCAECEGSCIRCLRKQNYEGKHQGYNCDKGCGAYVCHYTYRHMAEMRYLVSKMKNLPVYTKVLSIGCGPCSELISIEYELPKLLQKYHIDYLGIDMSEKWSPYHDKLKELLGLYNRNATAGFKYNDIANCFEELQWERFNIVVLNYFLSDFRSAHKGSMIPVKHLCISLNETIFSKMPANSYVLINDINHYKSRDTFDALIRSIGRHKEVKKYRFEEPRKVLQKDTSSYTNYGNAILTLPKKFSSGIFKREYSPWEECRSAQVLIQLK